MKKIKPCPVCNHSASRGFGVNICDNCGFQATPIHWDKLFNKEEVLESYAAGHAAAIEQVRREFAAISDNPEPPVGVMGAFDDS